jgi:transcription elongation factor GreA
MGRVSDAPDLTQHLSQDAYDRLAAEHEQLTTHGRVDIARKIQTARELGDLSENGDYHAAKEEQGKMEGRIRHLAAVLENAEIVDASASDVVVAGSVVSIRYEGDDEVERFFIGSIEERRDDLVVMSSGSPLGSALLAHAEGDVVEYEAPGGTLKVEIVAIES